MPQLYFPCFLLNQNLNNLLNEMNSPQEWNWNILLIGRCSWCESNYHRLRWQLCWIMKQIYIFLWYHMYFLRTLELLTVYRGKNIKKLWLKLNEALDFVIYTWSKCDRHLFTPLFFFAKYLPRNAKECLFYSFQL